MPIHSLIRLLLPVLAIAAAVSPFTLDLRAEDVVRLNEACGQATECEASSAHICSKADGDKIGFKCKKGCTSATWISWGNPEGACRTLDGACRFVDPEVHRRRPGG